jgi:uncharacterized protein YndB with AHSA1/START domain
MLGSMTEITLDVLVAAPAQRVWDLLFDWERQGEWMLGTRVEVTQGDGASVGSAVEAWTGAGPLGFLDTMTITTWDPPRLCEVLHTGKVVKGTGRFEVLSIGTDRCRFIWSEDLELPLGALGAAGWPLARPFFAAGVRHSLNKLARLAEAEHAAD